MSRMYRFDLVCPQCLQAAQVTATRRAPPPAYRCGPCQVELKVARVTVEPTFYPAAED